VSDTEELDTGEFPPSRDTRIEVPQRPTRPVHVEFGAVSDIGKVRSTNQDHFLISRMARTMETVRTNLPDGEVPERAEDCAYCLVVADGMGGMAAGDQASILAIRTGWRLVLQSAEWALKIDPAEEKGLIERMKGYFYQVDEALIEQTRLDPRLAGMGTTLTVAYSVGDRAFIVHAGDSRAYLVHDGMLHQLTHDHTLRGTRHVLTNFAGGPRHGIDPEIATTALSEGDRLMLCSDGLHGLVGDEEIEAILQVRDQPQEAARALVDLALERGGRDNVTVVIAQYSFPEDNPPVHDPINGRPPG
jgi:serine/threonine protein phosphatase PrpC